MKKRSLMILILCFALMISGCSKKAEEVKEVEVKDPVEEVANDNDYDVVVVGAGGAGLAAALSAHEQGADVIVLEKMPIAGGNSILSSAGMNASETKFQVAEGIEDSNQLFIDETMAGGYDKNDKDLVEFLASNSGAAIDWLDSYGIELSNITITGGMSVKRTHRPADGSAIGGYLVSGLVKAVEEKGIKVIYNADVEEILVDGDKKVTGVRASLKDGEETFNAKAVIVTTGGFGGNLAMVEKYDPALKGYVSTNHEGATGDGIEMITKIGGALVDPEFIQIHPTVEQNTSDLITEGLRGGGAILVNTDGNRFINELETRDKVSQGELEQAGSSVWILFDEKVHENFTATNKYINNGYVKQGDTIEDLAKAIEVDEATLVATIDKYNSDIKGNVADEYGRATGLELVDMAPFFAIKVAPGVHHTMGGVKINTNTEVLAEDGNIIEALYAAGEVTGGIHGGNRIGGNAVADIIVFGRQAGQVAGKYAMDNGGHGIKEGSVKVEEEIILPTEAGIYVDGQYEVVGKGHAGDIAMTITVENGNIVKIDFGANEETELLFDGARAEIVKKVIESQKLDGVEAVTGATGSSNGIIEGIQKVMDENKK